MCEPETTDNGDGTFTAFCYCGWSTDDFDSQILAEAHAEDHGRDFRRREMRITTDRSDDREYVTKGSQ